MNSKHPLKTSIFADLPEYNISQTAQDIVQKEIIIVLDDDPTGTQTVNDVPVLTTWDKEAILQEFTAGTPLFYILTNSRSLTELQTKELQQEIAANVMAASRLTSRAFQVISRSDSTLRGHFPIEPDTLGKELFGDHFMTILIPAFFEGGRYTIQNIHYVEDDGHLIPAADTPFAKDVTFGYTHSHLYDWVQEKSPSITENDIFDLSIQEIRTQDSNKLVSKILVNKDKKVLIVNACDYPDLERFYHALLLAKKQAQINIVFRTAASIVPVMGRIKRRPLLSGAEIAHGKNGGLIVVGSYVPKTTNQLSVLLESPDIHSIEVSVPQLLNQAAREKEIDRVTTSLNEKIIDGKHVVIYTTRQLKSTPDKNESLQINNSVSEGVVSIVKNLAVQPCFIIAKGGVTSSDVATKALNMKKARIMGQGLPGIPVWESGSETKFPGLPYVVFPGNVGNDDALKELFEKLIHPSKPK